MELEQQKEFYDKGNLWGHSGIAGVGKWSQIRGFIELNGGWAYVLRNVLNLRSLSSLDTKVTSQGVNQNCSIMGTRRWNSSLWIIRIEVLWEICRTPERVSQVALVVKNLPVHSGDLRWGFDPWVGKISWRKNWQSTPVFLPGEPHGQRRLVGYSPWGHKGSDTSEVPEHSSTRVLS